MPVRRQHVRLAAACLMALALSWVAAPSAQASPAVLLVGHGWGHGIGLGQYGAYGYAVDQGWTAGMILDHYYGGTTAGAIGNIPMSVALTKVDPATWVTSAGGFNIGDRADPSKPRLHVDGGSSLRVQRDASGWSVHTSFNGCSAPNDFGPFTVPVADIWLDADPGPTGTAARLLTTCANGTAYRGALRAETSGAGLVLVNHLPLETYLRSVTPSESPASWGDARGGWGIQALQAQAVAARSFAATQNRYTYAKTCDTDACQVYSGAFRNGSAVEDPRTDRAVAQTAGLVRRSPGGSVVSTMFSASTGGWTAGGPFTAVGDQGDSRSPYHTWTAELDGAALAAAYGVGTFVQLLVTRQSPGGPGGGRVLEVTVRGSTGSAKVTGSDFRSRWGLRSDWFFPVMQPQQEVTSTAYLKNTYSPTVYRQSCLSWNGWCDHAAITYADYVSAGAPPPAPTRTDYVKYPWSDTLYAVTYWPAEPSWQWHTLTFSEWRAAGSPTPRTAGFVYGTMYYTIGASATVYADGPDDVIHALTWDEWRAAGFPPPVRRG